MHIWGDTDFDWESLDKAIRFIDTNLVRWGRINVRQSKEKYGTARIYCSLGWHQFHSITHPRACFNRYPQWLWNFDCKYGHYLMKWMVNWWLVPWQKFVYSRVYYLACKRYPHLVEEICCMADYVELLTWYKRRHDEGTS